MKLDDFSNKEAYKDKEQEISERLKFITSEIQNYEDLEKENKSFAKKLKEIDRILSEPITINEFDREIFENIVGRIIVGEKDENGNENLNVVRFILKTGSEYIYNLDNNGNKNNSVSFGTSEQSSLYHMTHNKKKQDLLYFKGIINEYRIDLKVSNINEVCNDLKVIVSIVN